MRFTLLLVWFSLGITHVARAQATEPEAPRWSVEGTYGWTWVYGNDVGLGNRFSSEVATTALVPYRIEARRIFEPLQTGTKSTGQPFLRVSYDGGRWGFSGEASWLETDGSVSGSTPGSMGVMLWEYRFDASYDLTYEARNELSSWTVRFDVARELSPRLTLTVGVHGGELENSHSETTLGGTEDLSHAAVSELPDRLEVEANARMDATVIGPSVGLRFDPALGDRWSLSLSGTQSFLFTQANHEASVNDLESYSWFDLPFDVPLEAVNTLETELSTSSLVPVSDLRATASYALGNHVAVGATALVSVWFNVPRALRFSFRTAWHEPQSTLSFVNVGPFVKVTF